MTDPIRSLFDQQAGQWASMREGYASLAAVRARSISVRGVQYQLQCNPARRVSSAAATDAASVAVRRCFLCAVNRPEEQAALPFGARYELLVNPFPIFPLHLTIVDRAHLDQRIAGRFGDLLALASAFPDFVVFYNGPRCGASAPDHAHFQAGSRGRLPLESDWPHRVGEVLVRRGDAVLHAFDGATRRGFLIDSGDTAGRTEAVFDAVYRALPVPEGHNEPLLNLLAWRDAGRWRIFVFPRQRHRPSCFPRVLCSPASVDLAGIFVLPQPEDFDALRDDDVAGILDEVCPTSTDDTRTRQRILAALAAGPSPDRPDA